MHTSNGGLWSNAHRLLLAFVFLLGLATAPFSARAQGWYIELGIGQSEVQDFGCGGLSFTTCNADETDTGFSLHGGYKVNRHLAVEFGYTYLGFAKAEGTVSGSPFDADFESWGYDLAALGMLPLSKRVTFYGRAGFWRWKQKGKKGEKGDILLFQPVILC